MNYLVDPPCITETKTSLNNIVEWYRIRSEFEYLITGAYMHTRCPRGAVYSRCQTLRVGRHSPTLLKNDSQFAFRRELKINNENQLARRNEFCGLFEPQRDASSKIYEFTAHACFNQREIWRRIKSGCNQKTAKLLVNPYKLHTFVLYRSVISVSVLKYY